VVPMGSCNQVQDISRALSRRETSGSGVNSIGSLFLIYAECALLR
jgi:hypothetical protein